MKFSVMIVIQNTMISLRNSNNTSNMEDQKTVENSKAQLTYITLTAQYMQFITALYTVHTTTFDGAQLQRVYMGKLF